MMLKYGNQFLNLCLFYSSGNGAINRSAGAKSRLLETSGPKARALRINMDKDAEVFGYDLVEDTAAAVLEFFFPQESLAQPEAGPSFAGMAKDKNVPMLAVAADIMQQLPGYEPATGVAKALDSVLSGSCSTAQCSLAAQLKAIVQSVLKLRAINPNLQKSHPQAALVLKDRVFKGLHSS